MYKDGDWAPRTATWAEEALPQPAPTPPGGLATTSRATLEMAAERGPAGWAVGGRVKVRKRGSCLGVVGPEMTNLQRSASQRGDLGTVGTHFWLSHLGRRSVVATGIYWLETRGAANTLRCTGRPTMENNPAPASLVPRLGPCSRGRKWGRAACHFTQDLGSMASSGQQAARTFDPGACLCGPALFEQLSLCILASWR